MDLVIEEHDGTLPPGPVTVNTLAGYHHTSSKSISPSPSPSLVDLRSDQVTSCYNYYTWTHTHMDIDRHREI